MDGHSRRKLISELCFMIETARRELFRLRQTIKNQPIVDRSISPQR